MIKTINLSRNRRIAAFFSFLFVLAAPHAHTQGLELLPKEDYKKLHSPPMLVGSTGAPGAGLPDRYVIPAHLFPAVGNQGQQPSCTAWATGYALMSFFQGNVNGWNPNDQEHIFSPSYLYQNIKKGTTCTNGTYISDALNFLKENGDVPLSDFAYDANSCKMPPASLKTTASQYKIKDWFRVDDVYNLNDLKNYLSQGMPIVIAAYTDKEFSQFYNKKENEVFHWKSGNYKGGGHAMLVVGYDNSLRAFKVMNSWGTEWGSKGYVWIDYDSFRTMVSEAYVVRKDYSLPDEKTDPVIVDTATTTDLDTEYFDLYGYSEEIQDGQYYFGFGFDIDEKTLELVTKITYVYDDPSFTDKYVTVTKKPHFATAYEGWGCLEHMQAIIYFIDGSHMVYDFNACELVEEGIPHHEDDEEDEYDTELIEITPVISAEPTDVEGRYNFTIELWGIKPIADQIEKVVYDRNDPSFKQRYEASYDRANHFQGGYNGWGCLSNLGVTIYYYDGTTDSFEIDMCEALGW